MYEVMSAGDVMGDLKGGKPTAEDAGADDED